MGERKGQNKYYPPDFDWRKHSSLNAYQGVHALRERARKLDRGILIIRFEMPYNIWCNTCGNHIGMGVRYNAEKTKIGNYYTTPIFQFRMKCHLCDGHFEIKTDPKARDYVIVSGARREEQRWDAADNGQIVMESTEEMKKLATDAMFKLEYDGKDVAKKINKSTPDLNELEIQQSAWKDDYIINYVLRKNLREAKREDRLQKDADDRVRKKASIDIPLLPSTRQDDRLAKLYRLETVRSAEQSETDRREAIDQQQVLKGTTAIASEINWTPATFTSNKKQLSSALGIVRSVDKPQQSSETIAKSLVSYDDDDNEDEDS
ncbi:unnamed protein product [Rotaria magnacalcarata]|uniref:Coiled-coil domain-containing protein 130 n=3 Tax=Rotaria magnacalcarata TaxID=392030 RepID=A0A819MWI5_9BILA|nr:unnamed protein product [Rotaria magnacalcarata]CAF1371110.1 unnamed protein product [Rotaria magnacalcarata]CAF1903396.1 unnamed protein product [Rotaria magnacalcarata]CAF2047625.1 unnamed protein product [Rotaria magnacalcarata]CAF2087575.1 unnamed protein product [Rotaria magnacalcarata]